MDSLARGSEGLNYERRVFTVSELNRRLKELLEGSFPFLWVEGEISGLKSSPNGHLYFNLRDDGASLQAVLFRAYRPKLLFKLEDGMHVLCFGRLSLYEPRGQYQLVVQQVEPLGIGAFQVALAQLKEKLAREGLLDPTLKRPLPFLPKVVGLITSLHGAAIHDFLKVGLCRFPRASIYIYPVRVQGPQASQEILEGLKLLSSLGEVEVIVITRGGGASEDLWAFNDESLARAIRKCRVPVVSAVGHEIDYTICDLVADARAPTPTAAAELVFPRLEELENKLSNLQKELVKGLEKQLRLKHERLSSLANRLRSPGEKILEQKKEISHLKRRLLLALERNFKTKREMLRLLSGRLEALSPLAVLARGYSIVRRQSGEVVRDSSSLKEGEILEIILHKGRLKALIKEIL